jgi:hypothetical protein
MQKITIKEQNYDIQILKLNFEPQIYNKDKRNIRLSGIAKNAKLSEKWVNGKYKNNWIYTFRYLDEQDGFVSFEFDYNDKFLHKL